MVVCFIAMPVLVGVSVFSVKYRPVAKEALDCVFRKITLRKCTTGLDVRLKAAITSGAMKQSRWLGKFVYSNFEILSWLFFLLMLGSLAGTIHGGINFYLYGNCNGPVQAGFCVFDPTGHSSKITKEESCNSPETKIKEVLSASSFNTALFPSITKDEKKSTVILIACYDCDYSREIKPVFDELMKTKSFNFVFAHFPVKGASLLDSQYGQCLYEKDQEAFWKFYDYMFSGQKNKDESQILLGVTALGLDPEKIKACAYLETTIKKVKEQENEIIKAGVYGTPTVFIDGQPVVGPKPLRVYARMIKD